MSDELEHLLGPNSPADTGTDANPYEGIGRSFSNSLTPTQPLTADWITKGFEALREREVAHHEYQVKVATEYHEAMQDPAFADRQAALFQAAMDIGCPPPDPLNPPMVSKKMYDALQKRADQIQAEKL